MSDTVPNNNRAFQTSARSRKRVIKPKKWLTALLLVLLFFIGTALFFVIRYALKNPAQVQESSTEEVKTTLADAAPSEEGLQLLQEALRKEGLVLPDLPAA